MTLMTLAKISAAYLGFMVTFATASLVWENGGDLVTQNGFIRGFDVSEADSSG